MIRLASILITGLVAATLAGCQSGAQSPLLTDSGPILQPPATPVDPRLPVLPYDPARVVPLRAALNHQVTLVFAPGESIDTVAIGDSESWQATLNQRGDALVLKPLRIGPPTNMTIMTDTRIYSFLLTALGAPAADTPFLVRFDYPEDPPGVASGRWRLSGPAEVRPAAVTDDGRRTVLEWRPEQAIPAIFSLDERGNETLLNVPIQAGRSVLPSVPERLLFRLDGQSARAERRAERNTR